MKKLVGIFIVTLISIGVADLIIGILLTLMYNPNSYSTGSIQMANFIRYTISAITVTAALWVVYKMRNIVKKFKLPVKAS